MSTIQQDNKWDPLIEQIEQAKELPEKLSILATMVRMMAVNDLACIEARMDELGRKFDECMKKVYAIGVLIAVLAFTGLNIKTIIDFVVRIAK
jgi:hypothetical protein